MGDLRQALTIVVIVLATAMYFWFRRQDLAKVLEEFKDNFPPGGPPTTPMHPSPAGDDSLLRPNTSKPRKRNNPA